MSSLTNGDIDNIAPSMTDTWISYATTPTINSDGAYVIRKPEELAHLAKEASEYNGKTILLEANLDMAAHEWKPINITDTIFEGNGYTISNLKIRKLTSGAGLFGRASVNVRNLHLKNVDFFSVMWVGGIVGQLSTSQKIKIGIENCSVSGSVMARSGFVGGIVGTGSGNITNCVNYATVTGNIVAGGIVGSFVGDITGCKNLGDITCLKDAGSRVGGIAGVVGNGNVKNCLSECTITVNAMEVGGIVGFTSGGGLSVQQCGFKGKIINLSDKFDKIGSIVGSTGIFVYNCYGIAEIYTKSSDASGLNLYGASKETMLNSYAYTKVIYGLEIQEFRKYNPGPESFKDWTVSSFINGGYPFPTGMFAVGEFLPTQDIELYLVSYGFDKGLEIKTLQNSTYGTDKYVEMGKYPQTYVGSSMNTTLEGWYSGKTVVDTYTVDNGTSATSNVYNAYTYTDGKTYVRVPTPSIYTSGQTYEDGTTPTTSASWFKVEPIRWLILNYTDFQNGAAPVVVAEKALAANVTWNKAQADGNLWSVKSNIRDWLNGTFYNDAFSSGDEGNIVETTLQNNNGSDNDGTGVTTTDKVWLLSYTEVFEKYFTTSKQRYASSTDFAIANRCYLFQNSGYQTAARPKGGTTMFWLRTAVPSNTVCSRLVYTDGSFSYFTVFGNQIATRPALTINRNAF